MTDTRENHPEGIRLNKYLSESGICSRREADRMIKDGRVLVDGKPAETGMKIVSGQKVTADGIPVSLTEKKIFLAVYKPRGVVCTSEVREGVQNIIEYLNYPRRIFPVGRLDKDSEGLLLMTNDGETADRMMRARYHHEKEYEVTVDRTVTEELIRKLASGIRIQVPVRGGSKDGPLKTVITRKCIVTGIGEDTFRIVLTQGYNRQIRRMCEACGYRVKALKRIRIMNIHLGNMKEGAVRRLTDAETAELLKLLNV